MNAPPNPRRELLSSAHGKRCHYCGAELVAGGPNVPEQMRASIDHRKPKSRGGSNEVENLVVADALCNRLKGDMTEDEFLHFCATGSFAATYIEWISARAYRFGYGRARFIRIAKRHGREIVGGAA